jgi:hypothetical protein
MAKTGSDAGFVFRVLDNYQHAATLESTLDSGIILFFKEVRDAHLRLSLYKLRR